MVYEAACLIEATAGLEPATCGCGGPLLYQLSYVASRMSRPKSPRLR